MAFGERVRVVAVVRGDEAAAAGMAEDAVVRAAALLAAVDVAVQLLGDAAEGEVVALVLRGCVLWRVLCNECRCCC